jgi:hypothetical protein
VRIGARLCADAILDDFRHGEILQSNKNSAWARITAMEEPGGAFSAQHDRIAARLAKPKRWLSNRLTDRSNPLTWITMHEDLRHSPRCRVTFDALVEGLQHYTQ